jgi:hypothetical protein
VILWRVLPWDPNAGDSEPGGPLYFPRGLQGRGRHDNTARYGCMYVAADAASAVAEAVARFRGTGALSDRMLVRGHTRLALAELELAERELIDLDEPRVLAREHLRPSLVATHDRTLTQAYAERLFNAHPDAAGLRWWSTLESIWINVTLFDRARPALSTRRPEPLAVDHPVVVEAAAALGLA